MKEPDNQRVQRDEFEADSSTALGLNHSHRDAGTLRRLSISPDQELGKGALAKWDREERERIEAGAAEKREIDIENLMRAKDGDGRPLFTRKQAEEIVDREASKHGKEQKKLESELQHEKAIEDLMDVHKDVHGHSSSRTKRRGGKKPGIDRQAKYDWMTSGDGYGEAV